jgi:hypothetical protein
MTMRRKVRGKLAYRSKDTILDMIRETIKSSIHRRARICHRLSDDCESGIRVRHGGSEEGFFKYEAREFVEQDLTAV